MTVQHQAHRRAHRSAATLTAAHEVEIKLAVPEAARAAVRAELERGGGSAERLLTHYVDTPDDRLAAAGLSLRLRQQGPHWEQTLKADRRGGAFDRLEDTVARPAGTAAGEPQAQAALHRGHPLGERLDAALNGKLPVRRFTTEVLRRSLRLKRVDAELELAFDEGQITAGGDSLPLSELEIELKHGDPHAAVAAAADWLQRHGLWLAAEAKAARGARLLCERSTPPVIKAATPDVRRGMGRDAMLRAVVRSCLEQVMPNAAAVAGDAGWNDDHVHQLRVGLRRLRTAMRELAPLSPALDPSWEAPLADAFRALGVYRDSQIVRDTLPAQLRKAGAPDVAWAEQIPPAEAVDPVTVVRAAAFQCALLNLLGFVLSRPADAAGKPHLRRALRRRLKALHGRVAAEGKRFPKLPADEQHKVRKRLKRLRYLSEFAAPLYGEQAVSGYLERLHPAQDALGMHNDRVLAAERAAQAAQAGLAGADFAVDWLSRRRKKSARKSRHALARISRAQPFWRGGRAG
jgi:inorganic triphosphatase YgiF